VVAERDLSGLRALAEELSGQLAKVRSGMEDLQKELSAVTATVKSPDGYVTATVGPRGQLVRLQLDGRIYRNPDSAKLAATITETIQQATLKAGEKAQEVTAKYAPGVDVRGYLEGNLTHRLNRFDFITDQITEAGD
jgi:DNA-binding protein YbaB